MAHMEAYTRKDITKVTREAWRVYKDPKKYKNDVDLSKSHLNYTITGSTRAEFLGRLDTRCRDVMQGQKMQSQTKVIGSWVCTCPEELRGNPDTERRYFETCYKFVQQRYGAANVLEGMVHYDEGSPHMTIYTVPGVKSRKTGRMTISKASMFTRSDLACFHEDLDEALAAEFGRTGLALNGRTKGDYTLEELKERTKQQNALAAKEADLKQQEADLLPRIQLNNKNRKAIAARQDEQDARERAQNAREEQLNRREAEIPEMVKNCLQREKEAFWDDVDGAELTDADRRVINYLKSRTTKDGKNLYAAYKKKADEDMRRRAQKVSSRYDELMHDSSFLRTIPTTQRNNDEYQK